MEISNVHTAVISIHAPSRERQRILIQAFDNSLNFNPRSLAGATDRDHQCDGR